MVGLWPCTTGWLWLLWIPRDSTAPLARARGDDDKLRLSLGELTYFWWREARDVEAVRWERSWWLACCSPGRQVALRLRNALIFFFTGAGRGDDDLRLKLNNLFTFPGWIWAEAVRWERRLWSALFLARSILRSRAVWYLYEGRGVMMMSHGSAWVIYFRVTTCDEDVKLWDGKRAGG